MHWRLNTGNDLINLLPYRTFMFQQNIFTLKINFSWAGYKQHP